jgi:hypothetical protein
MPPASICHKVSTIGQRVVADEAVIPFPGFRIDRLADEAEQPQRLGRGLLSSPPCISARIAVRAA